MTEPDNPVSLKIARNVPEPALIECLESLLSEAKSGDLRGLVYITHHLNSVFVSGNAGDCGSRFELLGTTIAAGLDNYRRRQEKDE
ncbi:MAG TPA: hypothetical protein ENI27_04325 [bacterium]|nr:hypothetical protein [bacterium]